MKKPNRKKNRLKFLKNRPVWFYKPETKKTEPNRTQIKKPSQNRKIEPNQFEPVFIKKNRTEPKPVGLNQFWFFFNFNLIIFLIKIKPNKKWQEETDGKVWSKVNGNFGCFKLNVFFKKIKDYVICRTMSTNILFLVNYKD